MTIRCLKLYWKITNYYVISQRYVLNEHHFLIWSLKHRHLWYYRCAPVSDTHRYQLMCLHPINLFSQIITGVDVSMSCVKVVSRVHVCVMSVLRKIWYRLKASRQLSISSSNLLYLSHILKEKCIVPETKTWLKWLRQIKYGLQRIWIHYGNAELTAQ